METELEEKVRHLAEKPLLCGRCFVYTGKGSSDVSNMKLRVFSGGRTEVICDYLRGQDCHVTGEIKKCNYLYEKNNRSTEPNLVLKTYFGKVDSNVDVENDKDENPTFSSSGKSP